MEMTSGLFPHKAGHGCFGAVGDDFDGVEEVFAVLDQLQEAVYFGQFFDGDLVGHGAPLFFEGGQGFFAAFYFFL